MSMTIEILAERIAVMEKQMQSLLTKEPEVEVVDYYLVLVLLQLLRRPLLL